MHRVLAALNETGCSKTLPKHLRDLDEELKRKHVEIEDEFRTEQTRMQDAFKKQKKQCKRTPL
jgi:hypothetical protein